MVLLTSQDSVLKTSMIAPSFELQGVDGRAHSLAQFANKKAILVLFMCNHCPYVIPKMEYFVQLQKEYGPKGLQILAINSNDPSIRPEDSFDHMKKTAQEKGFNFPYLFDETQKVARAYGAVCTPDPFLFDSTGSLVYHGRFDDAHGKKHSEGTTREMEDAINQLLEGKKITIPTHPSMGCSIKWKS